MQFMFKLFSKFSITRDWANMSNLRRTVLKIMTMSNTFMMNIMIVMKKGTVTLSYDYREMKIIVV